MKKQVTVGSVKYPTPASNVMSLTAELPISVRLETSHTPAVLDLSGALPFDIFFEVRRSTSDLSRPMTIKTSSSIFDGPYAFSHGLIKLIDMRSNNAVDLTNLETDKTDETSDGSCMSSFITLPIRSGPLRRFNYDYRMPLRLAEIVKDFVTAGHRYRLQLNDSLDLGVKLWYYGRYSNLTLGSPRSLPQDPHLVKLVASKPSHRDFCVVQSLPKPPPVSVTMSLSMSIVYRSGFPPVKVCLSIANNGDRPITVSSSGDQPYITAEARSSPVPNHRRITSIFPPPALKNFSIIKRQTGVDYSPVQSSTCTLTSGSGGWSRHGLTTLNPGEPLINEFDFLVGANAIRSSMGGNDDFTLKLRPTGVWWHYGTLDDIFGDKTALKTRPGGPTPPLMLESQDELDFRFEE